MSVLLHSFLFATARFYHFVIYDIFQPTASVFKWTNISSERLLRKNDSELYVLRLNFRYWLPAMNQHGSLLYKKEIWKILGVSFNSCLNLAILFKLRCLKAAGSCPFLYQAKIDSQRSADTATDPCWLEDSESRLYKARRSAPEEIMACSLLYTQECKKWRRTMGKARQLYFSEEYQVKRVCLPLSRLVNICKSPDS